MHERLIEGWLDSASERSYQAPFVQMLAAEGHRIIHSTRHGPIELGKDIVSVAPDGTPCAFQLKGHPNGRLGLRDFRQIEPQLRDLTDVAIPFSAAARSPHRSYLVTNGWVEEEARLAIEQLGEANAIAGYPDRRIEIIQRGDLLDRAKRLGHSLWPTEIGQISLMLQMLVEDGRNPFPFDRANQMLCELLGLQASHRPDWSAAEVKRRVTSAAIMTSLSLKSFNEAGNHLASIGAWVQFACACIAACERFGISFHRNAETAVELALTGVKDSMVDMTKEVLERDVLFEGDAMADAAFYRPRYTSLLGMLSVLWFWCEQENWPSDLNRTDLEEFLSGGRKELMLWGEAAIPQALVYYWFLRKHEPGVATENLLAQLLATVASSDADRKPLGLPSPYWDVESVVRHTLAPALGFDQDEMAKEAIGGRSYFAEALLHLLVRTNRKGACKQLWPNVTRSMLVEFVPRHKWQYCLTHSEEGTYEEVQPPPRKEWSLLVEEARSVGCESMPAPLLDRPLLLMLFLQFFPYRGKPDVIRFLAPSFDPTWFIGPPRR